MPNVGAPPLITLLSDFGLSDPFVGILHAVIRGRCPHATVIDLCHAVPPQDTAAAAFWLSRCAPHLPAPAVHLCIVDPEVGTERAVLVGRLQSSLCVAPDSGCLPEAWLRQGEFRRLEQPARLCPGGPSATFHGRDLFAPLAAELATGRWAFADVGPRHRPRASSYQPAERRGDEVPGKVVVVDHFGNLLTNIETHQVAELGAEQGPLAVRVGARTLRLRCTYADAAPGELLALVNAQGVVEVAERGGSAATALGAARGSAVTLGRAPRAA